MIPWTPVEAGVYRVNQALDDEFAVKCSPEPGEVLTYGLLNNIEPDMRITPRKVAPTPDDLDELISTVWKEPAFFLAHPKAIAAFGRECTRRGVPPPTTTLFGSPGRDGRRARARRDRRRKRS